MEDQWAWAENAVDLTPEQGRWRARDVVYYRGPWNRLRGLIPAFELAPFRLADGAPANPYLRVVLRKPVAATELPIPIATVSPSYSLAPHAEVAELCLKGLTQCGIERAEIRHELGLSALGEWMNLRLILPRRFAMVEDNGAETALRLECFNSVDGSSRMVIAFGWLRFICSNGLIIGESMIEIRERHDGSLALDEIPNRIEAAFRKAEADRRKRIALQRKPVTELDLVAWVDGPLSKTWGKKAAARILHICRTGCDARPSDPFAAGKASEKPLRELSPVPGSRIPAGTVFDVMQAMSYVATTRRDPVERQKMLNGLDRLLHALRRRTKQFRPS